MKKSVSHFYNQSPENEWMRLFRTPYRRLEYEVIHYFLGEHITKTGHILDLGGGPGRYALSLGKRGHRVTLIDISEGNLALAHRKIKGAGLQKKIELILGDETVLSSFQEGTFDAVLCMGPLYHLVKEKDRLACLKECVRVLKSGFPLFATVYPRLSFLRDTIRAGQFIPLHQNNPGEFESVMNQGISHEFSVAETYFCHPNELIRWLENSGLTSIEMASTHGFVSFMDDQVNAIAEEPQAWNNLLQWVLRTCQDPQALSMAEYLLGIGYKL